MLPNAKLRENSVKHHPRLVYGVIFDMRSAREISCTRGKTSTGKLPKVYIMCIPLSASRKVFSSVADLRLPVESYADSFSSLGPDCALSGSLSFWGRAA